MGWLVIDGIVGGDRLLRRGAAQHARLRQSGRGGDELGEKISARTANRGCDGTDGVQGGVVVDRNQRDEVSAHVRSLSQIGTLAASSRIIASGVPSDRRWARWRDFANF